MVSNSWRGGRDQLAGSSSAGSPSRTMREALPLITSLTYGRADLKRVSCQLVSPENRSMLVRFRDCLRVHSIGMPRSARRAVALHRLDVLQTPREMSKLGDPPVVHDSHGGVSYRISALRLAVRLNDRIRHSMRIEQIELRIVRLPLVRPFQTSSSRKEHLDHILVRVVADGATGWGECASPSDPYYCPETTETCWHILRDFLAPLVLGRDWSTIDELVGFYRSGQGESLRAGGAGDGLLGPAWPALAGQPLHSLLGGTRAEILSGVSLGIESSDRSRSST